MKMIFPTLVLKDIAVSFAPIPLKSMILLFRRPEFDHGSFYAISCNIAYGNSFQKRFRDSNFYRVNQLHIPKDCYYTFFVSISVDFLFRTVKVFGVFVHSIRMVLKQRRGKINYIS
jgi:hypothetical protein